MDNGANGVVPTSRPEWAALAERLGVKVIHIAERDTQSADFAKRPGEFVNTWSIDGFAGEGCQPAELGWGTHERTLPDDGRRHDFGCGAAIYLLRPGAGTRVRTWTPLEGPFHGFLVTHNESISIADYLTVRDNGTVRYRPTVHYAYHPCDDAVLSLHEFAGRNWQLQSAKRLMMHEIARGMDELGVLLMGQSSGVYWYGSRLTIEEARRLAPYNNATSLQVTAAVLGGMVWAIENPRAGIVEADQVDHARVLEVARPYLGELVGAYGNWTPLVLHDRGTLFPGGGGDRRVPGSSAIFASPGPVPCRRANSRCSSRCGDRLPPVRRRLRDRPAEGRSGVGASGAAVQHARKADRD